MNNNEYCNIFKLYDEDICKELKDFLYPLINKGNDIADTMTGGRKIAELCKLNEIHKLDGFSNLSEAAIRQYNDHCNRMYDEAIDD